MLQSFYSETLLFILVIYMLETISSYLNTVLIFFMIGAFLYASRKYGIFADLLNRLVGTNTEMTEKINKLVDLGSKSSLYASGKATLKGMIEDEVVQSFLTHSKYYWLLKPILMLITGHFGGNDIAFCQFLLNEGKKYKVTKNTVDIPDDLDLTDLHAIKQQYAQVLEVVNKRIKQLEEKKEKKDVPLPPPPQQPQQ